MDGAIKNSSCWSVTQPRVQAVAIKYLHKQLLLQERIDSLYQKGELFVDADETTFVGRNGMKGKQPVAGVSYTEELCKSRHRHAKGAASAGIGRGRSPCIP